jgi:hypothetical protein
MINNLHFPILKLAVPTLAAFLLVGCGDGAQQAPAHKPAAEAAAPAPAAALKGPPPVLTAQVSQSPLFESPQGWGPGFAAAKAKAAGKGVVVGPGPSDPTVFAQQFPVAPGDQFKIVARASSADKPTATAKIQVNWLDSSSKFLSVSAEQFDVTPQEKTFETYVTAPAGATAATLYVTPSGKDDVVRYTEMRALGK